MLRSRSPGNASKNARFTTGNEAVFLGFDSPEGGYAARALGRSIYTEADTEAELRDMVRDAVSVHFDENQRPGVIRLHVVREKEIDA